MSFTYADLERWADLFEIDIFDIEELLEPYLQEDGSWNAPDDDNSGLPDIIETLITNQTGLSVSQIGAIIGTNN